MMFDYSIGVGVQVCQIDFFSNFVRTIPVVLQEKGGGIL